ncbi:MAG: hypothetical protein ACKVOX_05010 [Rhizobacter sp.]
MGDRSPKTAAAAHAVYTFESLADVGGRAIELSDADRAATTIRGVVASRHHARHGEPNGVILERSKSERRTARRYLLVALGMLCGLMTSANAQVSVGIGIGRPGVSIGINLPLYPDLVRVPGLLRTAGELELLLRRHVLGIRG